MGHREMAVFSRLAADRTSAKRLAADGTSAKVYGLAGRRAVGPRTSHRNVHAFFGGGSPPSGFGIVQRLISGTVAFMMRMANITPSG